MRKISIVAVLLLSPLSLTACSSSDEATDFPDEGSTELIVPYAPGGGTDIMARSFAEAIGSEVSGGLRTINLAGGGSVEGTRSLIEADPDGHTIEFSDVGAHIVLPLVGGAPFATDDYVHAARLTTYGFAFAVAPDNDWDDISDLIDAAKDAPEGLRFGTAGALTIDVVAAQAFAHQVGITLKPVPFESGGEAALAVKSGELDVSVLSMAAARSARDGDLVRILATTLPSDKASEGEPAMVDQGVDFTFEGWRGLVLPRDVSDDVVAAWGDAVTELGESDEWLAVVEERGETWDPLVGREEEMFVDEYEAQLQPVLDSIEDS